MARSKPKSKNESQDSKPAENSNGYRFEIFVEQLFKDCGYLFVRPQVVYAVRRMFTGKVIEQFTADLEYYDLRGMVVVECKYRERGQLGEKVVQEFYENLNRIRQRRGAIATNAEASSAAAELAQSLEIKMLDREQLERMDSRRIFNPIRYFGNHLSLDEKIKRIDLEKYRGRERYNVDNFVII